MATDSLFPKQMKNGNHHANIFCRNNPAEKHQTDIIRQMLVSISLIKKGIHQVIRIPERLFSGDLFDKRDIFFSLAKNHVTGSKSLSQTALIKVISFVVIFNHPAIADFIYNLMT